MKLVLTLIFFCASFYAHSATILVNDGFESGNFSPWYSIGGSPTISSSVARTGNYSIQEFGTDEIRQDFSGIPSYQITEVSFWNKQKSFGGGGLFQFFYQDGSTNWANAVAWSGTVTSDGWQYFNVTYGLSSSKTLTGIGLWGTTTYDLSYFDDILIVYNASTLPPVEPPPAASVPIPATVWLLFSGLFGLIGVARRKAA